MTPDELRAARAALGLSQAQIAAKLGVPLNTYQRWEQGHRAPGNPSILRLALERLQEGR